MKATLEFNLNDESDFGAYGRMNKSYETTLSLWEISQYLRSELKYNDKLSSEEYKALEKVQDKFYEIINNNGINLDELMK